MRGDRPHRSHEHLLAALVVLLQRDTLDDCVLDPEQPTKYPDTRHAVPQPLVADSRQARNVAEERRVALTIKKSHAREQQESPKYPSSKRLLISADAGGSNGYRVRLWKWELAQLAQETGLAITVCHFPPGTSKWNRIEHRLFAHITMNWRGRPLSSHEVVVELIGATTNRGGLTVHAEADNGVYPRGIKVTDAQMAAVSKVLKPHSFHGEWNYTVRPGITPV